MYHTSCHTCSMHVGPITRQPNAAIYRPAADDPLMSLWMILIQYVPPYLLHSWLSIFQYTRTYVGPMYIYRHITSLLCINTPPHQYQHINRSDTSPTEQSSSN